jgi:hypothetical protein
VCLLFSVTAMVRYDPVASPDDFRQNDPQKTELERQVRQLGHEVQQLQREQAMPAVVLHRYRNSICYVSGIYQVGYPGHQPEFRTRISGTGFVVADGLLATNRRVAEPWYKDSESGVLIRKGATPRLEKLLAFFPGLPTPVAITPVVLSSQRDLAVLRMDDSIAVHRL